jgi:hypothetical protein
MEADWEIEIGGDAPLIDAAWSGLIDLRVWPDRVNEVSECAEFPALGQALLILNGAHSPVWSSKCDFWVVENFSEFDRDEFAASTRDTCAVSCYIDLMARDENAWDESERAVEFCRETTEKLHGVALRVARVELVIRRAFLSENRQTTGVTAYITGGGETEDAARMRLGEALNALGQTLTVR